MVMVFVMLLHSGIWVSPTKFDRYSVDGIIVDENISYPNFISAIAAQIGIDETKKKIEARYIVKGFMAAMDIHNEMGVRVYMELKRNENGFEVYPLCICTFDREVCNSVVIAQVGAVDTVEKSESSIINVAADDDADVSDEDEIGDCMFISNTNHKVIAVNQKYKDKATVMAVMQRYAIENSFNFKVAKSCKKRYYLRCHSDDCEWSFKSSCINRTDWFKVRYFHNVHTCSMVDRLFQEQQATAAFVGGLIASKLEDHKRIHKPNDIISDMKRELGVDINYMKAWRAKDWALKLLRGGPSDGYRRMPRYIHMLNSVYHNSYIRMHKSTENEFLYLFIALYPLIRGFDYCRPVVVVDGSFLRGAYKGTFLCASTLDGAGHILPLAYGVADSENDSSWTWFFQQFKNAFGERDNMCVVSDRNESIIMSVSLVYPNIPHYACIFHLWGNVCKKFPRSKNKLSDVFYTMAKLYRPDEFAELMIKVGKADHRVKDYLEQAGVEKWARVYGAVNRGRTMTSNIAECINSRLFDARGLPILEFLEQARILFGTWNLKNGDRARYRATPLSDTFQDILEYNTEKSSNLLVKPSSHYIYTVYDDGRRFIVNLDARTCTCARFQYDEIPCAHGIAVLKSKHVDDLSPYCSDYYKKETVLKIYEVPLSPMPDKEDWKVPSEIEDEVVLPPKYRRPPGRPKLRRHKKKSEKNTSTTNCCGRCGHKGHNMRTCNFFPNVK